MKQYLDLMRKIVDEGEDVQSGAVITSEDRKATCRFLLGQQMRFDLRDGFPAVTTKPLFFNAVVDELLWFLRGETNVNKLGRFVDDPMFADLYRDTPIGGRRFLKRHIWDQWADASGNVNRIYGEAWRRWPHPDPDHVDQGNPSISYWDQVDRVVKDLRAVVADPGDRARRRIILTGWNPPVVPEMGLPPCHTLAQFLPTNGFLDVVCHWRSIDMFTGAPFNIAQYALLAHILGGVTGLTPRHLVCNIADCHIYDNQREQIAEQLTRRPLAPPELAIDPQFFAVAHDLSVTQLLAVEPAWFALRNYRCSPGQLRAEVAV